MPYTSNKSSLFTVMLWSLLSVQLMLFWGVCPAVTEWPSSSLAATPVLLYVAHVCVCREQCFPWFTRALLPWNSIESPVAPDHFMSWIHWLHPLDKQILTILEWFIKPLHIPIKIPALVWNMQPWKSSADPVGGSMWLFHGGRMDAAKSCNFFSPPSPEMICTIYKKEGFGFVRKGLWSVGPKVKSFWDLLSVVELVLSCAAAYYLLDHAHQEACAWLPKQLSRFALKQNGAQTKGAVWLRYCSVNNLTALF